MNIRFFIFIVLIVLFLIGSGVIVYRGRPIQQLVKQGSTSLNTDAMMRVHVASVTSTDSSQQAHENGMTFSLHDVSSHTEKGDCWAVINGDVYDLTSWVSRHPGGAQAILNLCGRDGSVDFNKHHGRFRPAQVALVLLKIGTLQ